jgi:hypothetical protein
MRGAELAWLMGEPGAWQAFSLDGGGSTLLWLEDGGSANAAGNRSVANHWAVFADPANGMPRIPGHCPDRPPETPVDPCPPRPAEGGTLDDADGCLELFGPERFWRVVDPADGAQSGRLHSTSAFDDDEPSNWARWTVRVAEPGRYTVQWHAVPEYAVFDRVRHAVRASGETTQLVVDQSWADEAGWYDLGELEFAAGPVEDPEGQWGSVYDEGVAPIPDDQDIVVDGLRLVPVAHRRRMRSNR